MTPELAIYTMYPRHVGKAKALKAIELALKRMVKGEAGNPPRTLRDAQVDLYRAVRAYAASPVGLGPKQWVPHPTTFLTKAVTWMTQRSGRSMDRIGTPASSALTKPSLNSEKRLELLMVALTKFGVLRGETMDAVRLKSYSKAFAETFSDDQDTLYVMHQLVLSERGEFEAKIPVLGDMLAMIRRRRNDRKRQEREQAEEIRWEAHKRLCEAEWASQPEGYEHPFDVNLKRMIGKVGVE